MPAILFVDVQEIRQTENTKKGNNSRFFTVVFCVDASGVRITQGRRTEEAFS